MTLPDSILWGNLILAVGIVVGGLLILIATLLRR